jgi:hypothetical protein
METRVWLQHASVSREKHTSFTDTVRREDTVEECLDELNDFVAGLRRNSSTVLAVALRVHLETLLQACLPAEARLVPEFSHQRETRSRDSRSPCAAESRGSREDCFCAAAGG